MLDDPKPVTSKADPQSILAYTRWHYRQNKAAYKARAKAKTADTRVLARKLILAHLLENPCIDCGEADPVVLEFDHRPGVDKQFNIGDVGSKSIGLKRTIEEMAKCDVRCSNCHKRMTYKRAGYTHKDTVH